jgi:hypothetical protein
MRRLARWSVLPSALVLAPALASCGGPKLVDAYMALDGEGARKREVFFTDSEQIWCIAEMQSGKTGVTVNATVRATQLDGVDGNYVVALGEQVPQTGKSTLGFELVVQDQAGEQLRDYPFVPGKYVCDIAIDGKPETSVEFTILIPPCPAYPVTAGTVCGGFYPTGAKCPAVDQSVTCTCEENGRWKC